MSIYDPITAIHYPIAIDPAVRQLKEESDYARHIRHLMLQVLMTAPGERINRPDFGCGLRLMVFKGNDVLTAGLTKVTVLQALEKWLGELIEVDEVNALAHEVTLEISVKYRIRADEQSDILNLEVAL